MDKTIYIVTTRSFNKDTLFNTENCSPINFDETGKWYELAFPQYFTDIIQFVDILEVKKLVFNMAETELNNKLISTIDSLIKEELNKEVGIRLKNAYKRIEEAENNEIKQKINKGVDKLKYLCLDELALEIKNKIGKLDELIHSMFFRTWELISGMKEDELNSVLKSVIDRKVPCWRETTTVNKDNISGKIANTVIENLLKHIISQSIPQWWPKLLYYKNRCLYWKSNEAKACYNFLKTTDIFEKAEKRHLDEVKNLFSLEHPIYKYKTDSKEEEWYIVRCFDMRTDPDFGLCYILSLIQEIDNQFINKNDAYSFNILIHDYDIGRKLIRSSVLLGESKASYNYENLQKDIKKALAEKELKNMIDSKVFFKPSSDFFEDIRINKPNLKLKQEDKVCFKIYSDILNYLNTSDCKKAFKKIKNIIVFKHNKGEIAKILKSKDNDNFNLIRFYFLHMQKILELRINLIVDIDKHIHGKVNLADLKKSISIVEKCINVAILYLRSLNLIYDGMDNFLINLNKTFEEYELNDKNLHMDKIEVYIKLLNNISSL